MGNFPSNFFACWCRISPRLTVEHSCVSGMNCSWINLVKNSIRVLLTCGSFTAALCAQTLDRGVISSGAVRSSNGALAMHGTVGQPIIGIGAGGTVTAAHGFWYRLSSSLSSIERTAPFTARITPQPAVTTATVELACSQPATAELLTLHGQRVTELTFEPVGQSARAQLDCSQLASGVYLLRLGCGSERMFLPLVIGK